MRIIAVAVVVSAASSCMTLYGAAGHRVSVTSTPSEARVFVDGEHAGATPVTVAVNSGDADPVITVEKDGYPIYRRRLQRSVSVGRTLASVGIGAGLGLVATMALAAARDYESFDAFALLPMAVGGLLPVTDWQSGALFKFPDRVDARLGSPAPGRPWSPERRRRERERWLREPRGLRGSLNLNRPPAARPSAVSFEPSAANALPVAGAPGAGREHAPADGRRALRDVDGGEMSLSADGGGPGGAVLGASGVEGRSPVGHRGRPGRGARR